MTRDSKLSEHKRFKKELKPPMLQIPNFKETSWINDRLPEMLWAVLVIGALKREDSLAFFRQVIDFVYKNKECYDVTLSGISKLPPQKKEELIKHMATWSEDVKLALRPLLLLSDLPAIDDWKKVLPTPIPDEDWNKIANGVSKTLWHQSEEATDCRWVKYLCLIVGKEIKFSKSIEGIDDTLKGIFEYPNHGDLRHIRPSIRAGEMMDFVDGEKNYEWSNNFWKFCFDHTGCVPEETLDMTAQKNKKKFQKESDTLKKEYFEKMAKIRKKLIDHFLITSKTSSIDSRHEGAFGIALYGATLFIEIIFYKESLSITGRALLRILVEAYIIFKYLLHKEKIDPKIWDTYRTYGTGQLKLIYLKLKESKQSISSINIDDLDNLANEDRWVEFTPINLGNWDSENLRKISEEVGLKNIYDKFYDYTSGFTHSSWGAIRESVYQKCVNPLHRYHRVPKFDLPLMESISEDAREVLNNILRCLSTAYPKFTPRLSARQKSNKKETND